MDSPAKGPHHSKLAVGRPAVAELICSNGTQCSTGSAHHICHRVSQSLSRLSVTFNTNRGNRAAGTRPWPVCRPTVRDIPVV